MIRVACIRCGQAMTQPAAWVIGHRHYGSGPVGPQCFVEAARWAPLPLSIVLTPADRVEAARSKSQRAGQSDWVGYA